MRKAAVSIALCLALLILPIAAMTAYAQGQTTHTVQPGENLFRIGLKYGLSWTSIAQANNLPNTYIYVGQQLLIPASEGAAPAPEPTALPAPAIEPTPEPVRAPTLASSYAVQHGDTLYRIALRHGTTLTALAQANGLANTNVIHAGQVLAIPNGSPIAAAQPDAPAPPPITAHKRIHVDISEQRMYVYEGDQLLWHWVASTGMAGANTAPGTYYVQSKIPNAYGGNWNIWMPHWLGIYWAGPLENGIHALPILPDGSRLWNGYLGTPISYGCVVLGIQEAETLYNWAEIGTEVTITS